MTRIKSEESPGETTRSTSVITTQSKSLVWISVVPKEGYCAIVPVLKFALEKTEEVSIGGSMMYSGASNICSISRPWRKTNFKSVHSLFVMWSRARNESTIEFHPREKCCHLTSIASGKKSAGFGAAVFTPDSIRTSSSTTVSATESSKPS